MSLDSNKSPANSEASIEGQESIVCPSCSTLLSFDSHHLPKPRQTEQGVGWWFSCGRCNHHWWVTASTSLSADHEKELKELRRLVGEFDLESFEPQRSNFLEKTNAQNSSNGKKNSQLKKDSRPKEALSRTDIQRIKEYLIREVREEIDQYTKETLAKDVRLRDPRNRELLEGREGSAFFPKKNWRTLFKVGKDSPNELHSEDPDVPSEPSKTSLSQISEPKNTSSESTNSHTNAPQGNAPLPRRYSYRRVLPDEFMQPKQSGTDVHFLTRSTPLLNSSNKAVTIDELHDQLPAENSLSSASALLQRASQRAEKKTSLDGSTSSIKSDFDHDLVHSKIANPPYFFHSTSKSTAVLDGQDRPSDSDEDLSSGSQRIRTDKGLRRFSRSLLKPEREEEFSESLSGSMKDVTQMAFNKEEELSSSPQQQSLRSAKRHPFHWNKKRFLPSSSRDNPQDVLRVTQSTDTPAALDFLMTESTSETATEHHTTESCSAEIEPKFDEFIAEEALPSTQPKTSVLPSLRKKRQFHLRWKRKPVVPSPLPSSTLEDVLSLVDSACPQSQDPVPPSAPYFAIKEEGKKPEIFKMPTEDDWGLWPPMKRSASRSTSVFFQRFYTRHKDETFEEEQPTRKQRYGLALSLFIGLLILTLVGAFWTYQSNAQLCYSWQHIHYAQSPTDRLNLEKVTYRIERRTEASNEFLVTISGEIVNPHSGSQKMPAILVQIWTPDGSKLLASAPYLHKLSQILPFEHSHFQICKTVWLPVKVNDVKVNLSFTR